MATVCHMYIRTYVYRYMRTRIVTQLPKVITDLVIAGSLTKEEHENLFRDGGMDIEDERVKHYFHDQFAELDRDGDGQVEIAEYIVASNLDDMLQEDKKKELKRRKKEFQKMRQTFLDADTGK